MIIIMITVIIIIIILVVIIITIIMIIVKTTVIIILSTKYLSPLDLEPVQNMLTTFCFTSRHNNSSLMMKVYVLFNQSFHANKIVVVIIGFKMHVIRTTLDCYSNNNARNYNDCVANNVLENIFAKIL